jgi:hypothetical protein
LGNPPTGGLLRGADREMGIEVVCVQIDGHITPDACQLPVVMFMSNPEQNLPVSRLNGLSSEWASMICLG